MPRLGGVKGLGDCGEEIGVEARPKYGGEVRTGIGVEDVPKEGGFKGDGVGVEEMLRDTVLPPPPEGTNSAAAGFATRIIGVELEKVGVGALRDKEVSAIGGIGG
jgi:hypothetical protein